MTQNKTYIRSSKHSLKFTNSGKLKEYKYFLSEMRKTAEIYINYLWNTEYTWKDKNGSEYTMNIINAKYDIPMFFDYNLIELPEDNKLSGRAKSSLITQCLGIVKATTEKQKKRLIVLKEHVENKKEIPFNLLKNIIIHEPLKPKTDKINLELSSKNVDFQDSNKEFNLFIKLKSLGKFKNINIPIKYHKQSNKWKNRSNRKGSVLCANDCIEIRWEFEQKLKEQGKTVGADQGKLTILTLSDGQTTPEKDKHGHSLSSIMEKLSRKKKGSKNFKKVQEHRTNFINWSINQLNFEDIKEVKYENVKNIYHGQKTSRLMRHWTCAEINKKYSSICEENGVQNSLQSSCLKSQRCSSCGWVQKINRKGKKFFCVKCGNELDADFNSSLNHEQELPEISENFLKLKLNRTSGFYWKTGGIFSEDGVEFRVPLSQILS